MVIGSLAIDLFLRQSRSLKDKRRVLLSIKDRVRQKFNVGVAEVAFQDVRQRARLGVVAVGAERQPVESALSKVVEFVRFQGRGAELLDFQMEFL